MVPETSGHLRRVLGVGFGLAVSIGGTIGVGILRTPGLVAEQLHAPLAIVLLWVAGGIYTLLGASWETALLVIFFASAVCMVAMKKERLAVALVLGFVVSSALMDARSTYDDAIIMLKGQRATGVEMFSDRAAEIIGRETWGSVPLDPDMASFVRYRLADTPYVPESSKQRPEFWITTNRNDGKVLLEYANYYLVKRTLP